MSKISPVSIKYIIRARFLAEGVVERPDVIGAIFGQTEGLLGEDLELRDLQKEGKIGRIEVTLETEKGSTKGIIEIPTSLDKAETALIAAALETIERVGPSEVTIKVETIEDVRASKRDYVVDRAKKLLKEFQEKNLPESSELKTAVTDTVRMMEITEFGRERLPAGPDVEESEDIIIVEGRADVLNLLRCGIKNTIALNGTVVPETMKELCGNKIATLFVDGDRGGELITKDVLASCNIEYLARAPEGKEVEELTMKEILKALRDKVKVHGQRAERVERPLDSERFERVERSDRSGSSRDYIEIRPKRGRFEYEEFRGERERGERRERGEERREDKRINVLNPRKRISRKEEEVLSKMMEDIIGTRGAFLLDSSLEILGKVPLSELQTALRGIKAYAIIADGIITSQMALAAEDAGCEIIIAKDFAGRRGNFKALTFKELVSA